MPEINATNYPTATVACFDVTCGELPRRKLDPARNNLFLERLASNGAEALLIGASTGHGHLRTPEELNDWFASTRNARTGPSVKIALLRPEDGADWHATHAATLADSGFRVAFVRPGTDLRPDAHSRQVADNMNSALRAASDAGLAVGVYSIPDVSGVALSTDATAIIRERYGKNLCAVKITEADYRSSTLRFLQDPRLKDLKIVQGWDPFLARALRDAPGRCGVTSGPMSFAIFQYQHILGSAVNGDWKEVESAQAAVTRLFQSMQDDPNRFADLQRAKVIMGLGQPLLGDVTPEQIERVFQALDSIERKEDRDRLARSLNLMQDGPWSQRLQTLIQE